MKFNYIIASLLPLALAGCDEVTNNGSSDQIMQRQQEQLLQEGVSAVPLPAIKNFREKRLLTDILEMRDQKGLTTYTYIVAEMTGKLVLLGKSFGYGIPYSTQLSNPQKIAEKNTYQSGSYAILPQAEPNGLFSPASAEGTWVIFAGPNGEEAAPVLIEPRIIVSPFPLNTN